MEATRRTIRLVVNGKPRSIEVAAHETLLAALKERLYLTGAKEGCGVGECGACTVLLDGRAVNACLVLAVEADGRELGTIEGEARPDGSLSALQRAFIDHAALQCGFCTPGMVLSARALLRRNPRPSREEIVEAIAGNLCRCTGYEPVIDAIAAAAEEEAAEGSVVPPAASAGAGEGRGP
ncbi:MAG: (2Fe-2S)-binding protein [Acidobacteria bacterium]|nr:(2Fe-2S)-binding protein [Acidobacteriota bacterium]